MSTNTITLYDGNQITLSIIPCDRTESNNSHLIAFTFLSNGRATTLTMSAKDSRVLMNSLSNMSTECAYLNDSSDNRC